MNTPLLMFAIFALLLTNYVQTTASPENMRFMLFHVNCIIYDQGGLRATGGGLLVTIEDCMRLWRTACDQGELLVTKEDCMRLRATACDQGGPHSTE